MSKRKAYSIITGLELAIVLVVSIAIRLSNPELTETQLLVNYLPLWVGVIAGALIFGVWFF